MMPYYIFSFSRIFFYLFFFFLNSDFPEPTWTDAFAISSNCRKLYLNTYQNLDVIIGHNVKVVTLEEYSNHSIGGNRSSSTSSRESMLNALSSNQKASNNGTVFNFNNNNNLNVNFSNRFIKTCLLKEMKKYVFWNCIFLQSSFITNTIYFYCKIWQLSNITKYCN